MGDPRNSCAKIINILLFVTIHRGERREDESSAIALVDFSTDEPATNFTCAGANFIQFSITKAFTHDVLISVSISTVQLDAIECE